MELEKLNDWEIRGVMKSVMYDSNLSLESRALYVVLRGYLGKNCEKPWRSQNTLAQIAGRPRKVIQRWLKELDGAGLIARNLRRMAGKFSSDSYEILDKSSQAHQEQCNRRHRRPKTDLRLPTFDNGASVSALQRNNHNKEESNGKDITIIRKNHAIYSR